MLNRSKCSSLPRRIITVQLPEIDDEARLQEMNGAERVAYQAYTVSYADGKTKVELARIEKGLIARCLIDERGARLYGDDEVDQLAEDLPAGIFARLYGEAATLNGLQPTAVEDAKKNSESSQTSASPSV